MHFMLSFSPLTIGNVFSHNVDVCAFSLSAFDHAMYCCSVASLLFVVSHYNIND